MLYCEADDENRQQANAETAKGSDQVDWTHGLTYYNDADGSKAHLYAWAKVFEVSEDGDEQEAAAFRSGDKENGVDPADDLVLNLDRTFRGYVYESFYKPMKSGGGRDFALEAGRLYRFKARQSLEDRQGQIEWKDRENGGDTFESQTWRFDPKDEFEGNMEWVKGGNYVYED